MDEFRRQVVEVWEQVKAIVRRTLDALKDVFDALRPVLHHLRGMKARADWRTASRAARFVSRHPDIAEFDGWLDRWYPDPALV